MTQIKILTEPTGSNKNKDKAEAKSRSTVTTSEAHSVKRPDDKSIKDRPVAQHEHTKTILPINNPKILADKHSNEKLAITPSIVKIETINYHF